MPRNDRNILLVDYVDAAFRSQRLPSQKVVKRGVLVRPQRIVRRAIRRLRRSAPPQRPRPATYAQAVDPSAGLEWMARQDHLRPIRPKTKPVPLIPDSDPVPGTDCPIWPPSYRSVDSGTTSPAPDFEEWPDLDEGEPLWGFGPSGFPIPGRISPSAGRPTCGGDPPPSRLPSYGRFPPTSTGPPRVNRRRRRRRRRPSPDPADAPAPPHGVPAEGAFWSRPPAASCVPGFWVPLPPDPRWEQLAGPQGSPRLIGIPRVPDPQGEVRTSQEDETQRQGERRPRPARTESHQTSPPIPDHPRPRSEQPRSRNIPAEQGRSEPTEEETEEIDLLGPGFRPCTNCGSKCYHRRIAVVVDGYRWAPPRPAATDPVPVGYINLGPPSDLTISSLDDSISIQAEWELDDSTHDSEEGQENRPPSGPGCGPRHLRPLQPPLPTPIQMMHAGFKGFRAADPKWLAERAKRQLEQRKKKTPSVPPPPLPAYAVEWPNPADPWPR
jgi:hypothetical protein